jgi:hypothetical protein
LTTSKLLQKAEKKSEKKLRKKKKRTALIVCSDRKQFWTTQPQFWQWVRDAVIIKIADAPLTGTFARQHEELMVLLGNTILNLAHPNHIREAMLSRRVGMARKRCHSFAPSTTAASYQRPRFRSRPALAPLEQSHDAK